MIEKILNKSELNFDDIVFLLNTQGKDKEVLFRKAMEVKEQYVGKKVYFRGLIEYSNICSKNCYYCGIRSGNKKVVRYKMTQEEVFEAVKYAHENNFASLVIQGGEISSHAFAEEISDLLKEINRITDNEMGITLSLGEQEEYVYKEWKENGARRYLMRIEESDMELYRKLHPNDAKHSFTTRVEALHTLKKLGYQVGTGIMIGLPFQTIEHLANDLIFMRDFDIDMVGMGPYIEHEDTPLYQYKDLLPNKKERFELTMKMLAILRIMMKDINIAATTAMQTLDPLGREKAIKIGANVIMPNLTPVKYRESYLLYEDKPCLDEEASECKNCLEARIHLAGSEIGYGEWGDSIHYAKRQKGKH